MIITRMGRVRLKTQLKINLIKDITDHIVFVACKMAVIPIYV
jgi:hypothetical protein